MTRGRLSLGGGQVLQDSTSYFKNARSRRNSIGCNNESDLDKEESRKERKALMQEWKQKRKNESIEQSDDVRMSTNTSIETFQPMTPLERFKIRRKIENDENKEAGGNLPPVAPSYNTRLSSMASLTASSDNSRSRLYTPNKRVSKARRRTLSAEPTKRERSPEKDLDVSYSEDMSTVERVGLNSRIETMQAQINHLEQEKINLTKLKAPLEARIKEAEEALNKQQERHGFAIEELKQNLKESNERCIKQELDISMLKEENKNLKYELLKAGSSRQHQNDSEGVWTRQIQIDRDHEDLKTKLEETERDINAARLEKVSLVSELDEKKRQLESMTESYNQLTYDYHELKAKSLEKSDAESQLSVLTDEHIATVARLNALDAEHAELQSSLKVELEQKDEEMKVEIERIKFEFQVERAKGFDQSNVNPIISEDNAILLAKNEALSSRVSKLEEQVQKLEQTRRKQHNIIQELRGNIRVNVRTRPFLPGDGSQTESAVRVSSDGESLLIEDDQKKSLSFSFDKIFPPSAGQDTVFDEVSDFVQSALDGYHVCLFSYGQTGSGKTHTMQGSGKGVMRGIIPRAVEQILKQVKVLHHQKWKYDVTASFLEIYNEELRDLLADKKQGTQTRSKSKLAIRRTDKKRGYIEGLSKVKIDTEDITQGNKDLQKLMNVAARSRAVASTNMNSQSSRSHSIFMLHLSGVNQECGKIIEGSLNLCDLAGSERLDRSGAATDPKRLKETQAINKSLSCLGDVFSALSLRSAHIPYRNSKLTHVLQDCLSGDGKALMFVNLSPTIKSRSESLCSLRFAQRVSQIELGKATKNVHYVGQNFR